MMLQEFFSPFLFSAALVVLAIFALLNRHVKIFLKSRSIKARNFTIVFTCMYMLRTFGAI